MAVQHQDINAALLRKIRALNIENKGVFTSTFKKAPLMLSFLAYLEAQKQDTFRTRDAVQHLYKIKFTAADYAVYENRFFKLRKKIFDYFSNAPTDTHPVFTHQELQLHEIKNLNLSGKHNEAFALLQQLEERLWKENIFELLPEVLDLIIYHNQVQRMAEQNKGVYTRMQLAIALLNDLNTAKMLARQIYDVNITLGIKATAPLFIKLQRLSINRKAYPRFKLIYNFISATCKQAGGGFDFKPDFKVTNRFIKVITRIHALHPSMPDYRFMAGYSETQSYMFENLKMMNYFNSFHFKEAAAVMKSLYDNVMHPDSKMKRMRGPTFFFTTCLALNASGRHHDALLAASDYLKYTQQIKQTAELPSAYLEVINAHIEVYPAKSGYTEKFITEKLESSIKALKTADYSFYYLPKAHWIKIKLLLVQNNYTQALSLFNATDFSKYFSDTSLKGHALKTLELLCNGNANQIAGYLPQLHTARLKTVFPIDYTNYTFLEKILKRKIKA